MLFHNKSAKISIKTLAIINLTMTERVYFDLRNLVPGYTYLGGTECKKDGEKED